MQSKNNKTNKRAESNLQLLLSRLIWPSPLVQERSCRALASLMRDKAYHETTWRHLRAWIQSRQLEMECASGLLVLARVAIEEYGLIPLDFEGRSVLGTPVSEAVPEFDHVVDSLSCPSLLSWMLLRDIYHRPNLTLQESASNKPFHSGTSPTDFESSFFFKRYCTLFIPPIYNRLAISISKGDSSFHRQWAFEWQGVVERAQLTLDYSSFDYWLSGSQGKEHCRGALPRMGQAFRSAFLRALAWAHGNKLIADDDAFDMAAMNQMVDLELWQIEPSSRPAWWPRAEEEIITPTSAEEDESTQDAGVWIPQPTQQMQPLLRAPIGIWEQVEELWNKSAHFDAAGCKLSEQTARDDSRAKWQLVAAQGPVLLGESFYFLEIAGFFQRCVGPKMPELSDIAGWLAAGNEPKDYEHTEKSLTTAEGFQVWGQRGSPLRFKGVIKPEEIEGRRFADWEVLAAARRVMIWTQMPWQPWRSHPCIWFPAPCLSLLAQPNEDPKPISFGSNLLDDKTRVLTVHAGSQVLGHWRDWADGLRESTVGDLPALTGQQVVVPHLLIQEFAEESESVFCWLCRLTGYVRKSDYEDFKHWSECRIFGASHIAKSQTISPQSR